MIDRFWAKVDRGAEDGCWLYYGYVNRKTGYGYFGTESRVNGRGSVSVLAHRFSFIISGGTFEKGPDVLHTCIGQRDCVNPKHLYAGTKQDNANDKVRQNRQLRGEQIPNATIPDAKIPELFLLRSEGKTQKEIANVFGVVQQTVSRILNKRTRAGGVPSQI